MLDTSQSGLTLTELMVVVAVLAIMLAVAAPNMSSFIESNRLRGAAETAASTLQLARTEAIKRNTPVVVTFDEDAWCYGLSVAAGCDCTVTDTANASACVLASGATPVLKVVSGTDYPQIAISSLTFAGTPPDTEFDNIRGTANTGSVTFQAPNGNELRVTVSGLGRVIICAPSGGVWGFETC